MTVLAKPRAGFPAWLPDNARLYLRHTEEGLSIRELARAGGCHASTVLRKVRAFENRRDDPLIDEALNRIGRLCQSQPAAPRAQTDTARTHDKEGTDPMAAPIRNPRDLVADEATVTREARRVLRRLCEIGAVLAVAPDLDKAAVLKGDLRIAVLDRAVAQAFALKDWIAIAKPGRVTLYEITAAGRAALKRLLAADQAARGPGPASGMAPDLMPGMAEAQTSFADQHRVWDERAVMEPGQETPRRMRYNLAESPLAALARRREKDGKPFIGPDLVAAGERLREDFEIAQMGPRVAQNWDRFLTAADRGGFSTDAGPAAGPARARERVALALRDLGPGLGDMVLRCCCFLEGLETAEKRMGWSARSGKIVLRIALLRLRRHYDETYGGQSPLIG